MFNAQSAAAEAYGTLDARMVHPLRAEALVFAKVTRRLEAALAGPPPAFAALAAILHDNRRLWLAAAAATADDGNALPEALRAQIVSLAGFVERHTSGVLRGTADPAILVELNRRIAGGLTQGAR